MLSLIAFVIGAIWGAYVARKRGGNRLDIAQYALVHGIIFAILALIGFVIFGT
jgi:hypothetical protein